MKTHKKTTSRRPAPVVIKGFGTGEQQRARALADALAYQKLSLAEAGKFDEKFRKVITLVDQPERGPISVRVPTTAWEQVCIRRKVEGTSRKARIEAAKAAKEQA
jgi:hypothetical protein